MNLFKQQIVTYKMADGSYRTPDGRRVTSSTPGAVRHESESAKWYATINGRKVPLSENRDTAKRLYRMKTGESEVSAALPAEARRLLEASPQLEKPLGEHLEDYRRYLEARNNSGGYVVKTIARCKAVLDACGFKLLGDLDGNAVLDYLASQRKGDDGSKQHGFGIATSNHYIGSIKGFSRWLVGSISKRTRQTLGDPLFGLKKLPADADVRVKRRALSGKDFAALLTEARKGGIVRGLTGPERATLYTFAAYTGLRASEVASLTPKSFDLGAEVPTVTVAAAYSKHRREDVLPLQADVARLVRDFIAGKNPSAPLWPGNASAPCESWHQHAAQMIEADLKAAKLEQTDTAGRRYDFHALRHQFASNLGSAGVTPGVAKDLLRHSTIALTMNVYTHLGMGEQVEALRRLPAPPANGEAVKAAAV